MAIDYESHEWADYEQGGTPITAEQLNRMEGGIADACRGVDTLAGDRLQTYRVASGGDTATQDAHGDAIVGPCLVFDEAICGTYYEPGDGAGDRRLIASADEIEALRDSVSRIPKGMAVVRSAWGFSVTVRIDTGRQAIVLIGTNVVAVWRSATGLDLSSHPYGLTAALSGDDVTLTTDYQVTWSVLVI